MDTSAPSSINVDGSSAMFENSILKFKSSREIKNSFIASGTPGNDAAKPAPTGVPHLIDHQA